MLSQVFSRSILILISKLRQNLSKPAGTVNHFVICCIFRVQILLAARTNPKTENHHLSVTCHCLFNIFSAITHVWRPNFVLKASKFFRLPEETLTIFIGTFIPSNIPFHKIYTISLLRLPYFTTSIYFTHLWFLNDVISSVE
jgi:hypothetical protein